MVSPALQPVTRNLMVPGSDRFNNSGLKDFFTYFLIESTTHSFYADLYGPT